MILLILWGENWCWSHLWLSGLIRLHAHSQNIQKLILLWLAHRWKIKARYCYEESLPIIIDDRFVVSKHYYFWWTINYIISDYEKSSPYSHLPVCSDIQSTSNNVVRSLPSIVDKIDLSVIQTKLNHYQEKIAILWYCSAEMLKS